MNKQWTWIIAFAAAHAWAADGRAATEFAYPELAMVPRYSDRIDQEAQRDPGFFSYWQFQLGGWVTAGMMATRLGSASGAAANTGAMVGAGIGGAWALGGALLGAVYKPYLSAQKAVAAMPRGPSPREQLTRERLAEAEVEGAESFVGRLRYLMLASDLFAAFYYVASSGNGFNSSTDLPVVAAAALSGFIPFVFKPYPLIVAEQQRDYRKKIFSPVAGFGLAPGRSPDGGASAIPSLTLSWRF